MAESLSNTLNDRGQAPIQARLQLDYGSAFQLDVDLTIPGKGITGVFGPSGSGKTSLLRCIAGLEQAQPGKLIVKGKIWQDQHYQLPTHQRPIGYVFQEASLFEHLSVQRNLDFARKRASGQPDPAQQQRIASLLDITPFLHRYPHELSGGERQRVAIARAIMVNPEVLLMDEPLASLDNERKRDILPYLEELHASYNTPIIYVSHSVEEIARLADHVILLDKGRVVDEGLPANIFSRLDLPLLPGDEPGVIVQATVIEREQDWRLIRVGFDGGELWTQDNDEPLGSTVRLRILARDVSLTLSLQQDSSILNRVAAVVDEIATNNQQSAVTLVRLKAGREYFIARLTRRSVNQLSLHPGKRVWAQIKSAALVR